jgi:hypothetical protein
MGKAGQVIFAGNPPTLFRLNCSSSSQLFDSLQLLVR